MPYYRVFSNFVLCVLIYHGRAQFGVTYKEPRLECLNDGIRLHIDPIGQFVGHVYVRGYFSAKDCHLNYCNPPARNAFMMYIPYRGNCNVRRHRQPSPPAISYEVTVVLQHHPMFVTSGDRAFRLNCIYKQADTKVTQKIDINDIPSAPIESISVPTCRYDVLSGTVNGPVLRFANVGDPVVHKWSCHSDIHGFLVHSCFVRDEAGAEFKLVDERGCVTDSSLVPDVTYSSDQTVAFTTINAFRFADRIMVHFSCQITLCRKSEQGCEGISPPTCHPVEFPPIHAQYRGSSSPPPPTRPTPLAPSNNGYYSATVAPAPQTQNYNRGTTAPTHSYSYYSATPAPTLVGYGNNRATAAPSQQTGSYIVPTQATVTTTTYRSTTTTRRPVPTSTATSPSYNSYSANSYGPPGIEKPSTNSYTTGTTKSVSGDNQGHRSGYQEAPVYPGAAPVPRGRGGYTSSDTGSNYEATLADQYGLEIVNIGNTANNGRHGVTRSITDAPSIWESQKYRIPNDNGFASKGYRTEQLSSTVDVEMYADDGNPEPLPFPAAADVFYAHRRPRSNVPDRKNITLEVEAKEMLIFTVDDTSEHVGEPGPLREFPISVEDTCRGAITSQTILIAACAALQVISIVVILVQRWVYRNNIIRLLRKEEAMH